MIARGIESGPDQRVERLRWTLIGGLNAAQSSVRVLTPYFLPEEDLVRALRERDRRARLGCWGGTAGLLPSPARPDGCGRRS